MTNSKLQPLIKTLLISILFILFQKVVYGKFECNHDKLNLSIQHDTSIISHSISRKLLVEDYQGIRIHADFSLIAEKVNSTVLDYLQNRLLPDAINYYKQALKVIPLDKKLTTIFKTLCDLPTPDIFLNQGVDSDLGIIVDAGYENTSYIAYARACVLSGTNNRPVFGNVHFNLKYLSFETDKDHQQNLIVALHEMAHVLGISQGLFEFFYNPDTGKLLKDHIKKKEVNGVNSVLVDVEPLTSRLRNFFDCQDIEGALLENEGEAASTKSHLERRVFFDEIMTASDIENARISEFMLAFLEGTGWYKGNYSIAEPLYWGKGKGCSFYYGPCLNKTTVLPNYEEFCPSLTEVGCSNDRRYGASCGANSLQKGNLTISAFNYWGDDTVVSDMFADNCPYFVSNSDKDCEDPFQQGKAFLNEEVFAVGSKCFTGDIRKSSKSLEKKKNYCLKSSCEKQSDSSFIMKITLGEATATCKKAGPITIPGYNGQLDCPDPNAYCNSYGKNYCSKGCMGKGECVNNTCQCKDGWGGNDCGYKVYKSECSRCSNNPLETFCYGDGCSEMPVDRLETGSSINEANNAQCLKTFGALLWLWIILMMSQLI